jgi:hypothetical protein
MAERAPLHQQAFAAGRMVPAGRDATMPLLPYEKQLIHALGCSEAEYREFVQQLERRAYTRPAGYEHVPDVRMDVVSIVISVVIGAALSAASYLLTPKPKLPSASEQQRQTGFQELGGVQGLSNYSPSTGFDSLQSLATYGSVVPIAFTLRQDHPEGFSTGGLLISPQMVWSRLKSWGTFQVIEMVAVAGQGTMIRPDQAGLFLGNNALDSLYESFYQFYWASAGFSSSRLLGRHLRYGTLAFPAPPAIDEDAFVCPTRAGVADTGFCGAFTPANQTQFGVFSAIPNGTPFRPNWEVVGVLRSQEEADDKGGMWQAITTQSKYWDNFVAANHPYGGIGRTPSLWGQPGTGRNFARHVGIVEHNGFRITGPTEGSATVPGRQGTYRVWNGELTATRTVAKNDTIKIRFGYGRQDINALPGFGNAPRPDLNDIRSALDAEAQQQDQAFTPGAVFMIGRSTWRVTDRKLISNSGAATNDAFNPGGGYVEITMQCLETWSRAQNKIGLVSPKVILESGWMPGYADIDETWYPICKVQLGQIVNNRACDVTEIGLKSQCWVQFNGITNFNTVPSPGRLVLEYNQKDITPREGRNTSYGKRTSFFALDVRPANDESVRGRNDNEGFVNVGPHLFAVTGSTPQDIFSFIRISHPETKAYEFRLRPFVSSVFTQQSGGEDNVFQLNGAATPYQEWDAPTEYGTFKVGGRGRFIKPREQFTHPQMVAQPDLAGQLVYGEFRSTGEPTRVSLLSVTNATDGSSAAWNTISNIMSVAAGRDPYFDNLPNGTIFKLQNWSFLRDPAKTITMTVTLESFTQSVSGTPRNKWWRIIGHEVSSYTGTWAPQDTFAKSSRNAAGVQFFFNYQVDETKSVYFEFDRPRAQTRSWESYSGIAEVSHYGSLISRSCDNGPEHQVVYVNESLAEDQLTTYSNCAMVGLKLQSTANITSLDQLRAYLKEGVQVERLTDGGTGASNLITDLLWYLCTNRDTGAGSLISSDLLDRDQLIETGRYLRANKLFFDDVITEPINLRSWIAEKCPSLLCYITIKNGKLAVNPALPYGSDYKISSSVPAQVSAMFTDGNVIEGSFQLEWLDLEERKMFQAAVIYRKSGLNRLPEPQTMVVRYAGSGASELALEEFNLPHVTSDAHALLAAKYFLALRKHVTHTISFRTLPYGLSLAPGDYIMVSVEMSPYRPSNNGIIQEDGTLVTVSPLADGNHQVFYWDRSQTTIQEGTLRVSGGVAQNLRNTIVSVKSTTVRNDVYMVEALDVDQEGIVTVKASSFPVDANGISLISKDVLSTSTFEVIGGGDG